METMEQNSDEWSAERKKRLGASTASCRVGHGPATICDHWRLETGRIVRDETDAMKLMFKHGHDTEPEAAEAYTRAMGRTLEKCGLYVHPTVPWLHASPDRLVVAMTACGELKSEGLLEIKCPYFCWLARKVPEKHVDQIQQQLACADREWCDYICYMNKDNYRIWRVHRSRPYWEKMFEYLDEYASCLADDVEPTAKTHLKLRQKFPSPPRIEMLAAAPPIY